MSQYRTAQGRNIDMSALVAKNEKARAVGNMKVNARGDTIDSNGKVIKSVTSKVNEQYAKTVGNRSARPTGPVIRNQKPQPMQPDPIITDIEEKLPTEEDFDSEDDLEIEQIKEQEIKEATKAKK